MTLSTTSSRVSYAANGATASFAFAFKIWAASNLKVYLRDNTTLVDTLQTLTTEYTIDIVTYPNTGNVVFVTAPATGKTIVIVRDMPLTQDLDLIASGSFAAENVEIQLDKLAAEIQTLREMIARTPRLPIGSALADMEFGNLDDKAGYALTVNNDETGFTLSAAVAPTSATVSAFGETLIDDADAGAAQTTLGISTFFKTLLDDATAPALFTTLGFLKGSATIDFGSIGDNASSTASNVNVTGAAVGDLAFAFATGDIATTDQIWLFAKVTAADTVGVNLHNDSNGSFNAASQTVNAFVIPKSLFGL